VRDRTSEEYKKAIVRKMASSSLSGRQFAIEEGVALATLHKWKTKYRCDSIDQEKSKAVASDNWSLEEKFAVVLESASLSEIELGEYCRRKGIYPEHVSVWKHACIQGNMKNSDHKRKADSASKTDKKRIRELERELARKEKALAEAAALLLLRKKLDALWDENEED
jgi:transposase